MKMGSAQNLEARLEGEGAEEMIKISGTNFSYKPQSGELYENGVQSYNERGEKIIFEEGDAKKNMLRYGMITLALRRRITYQEAEEFGLAKSKLGSAMGGVKKILEGSGLRLVRVNKVGYDLKTEEELRKGRKNATVVSEEVREFTSGVQLRCNTESGVVRTYDSAITYKLSPRSVEVKLLNAMAQNEDPEEKYGSLTFAQAKKIDPSLKSLDQFQARMEELDAIVEETHEILPKTESAECREYILR